MTTKTILIVEDNPMNQEIASELLNDAGYNVYSVDDADSAIIKTQNIHPDLVLMDLHLPGKDGFEATRELKSLPDVKDIPIVAFTALAMDEDQKKALEAGCSGIITKPIDVNTFCLNIKKYLSSEQPVSAPMRVPLMEPVRPVEPQQPVDMIERPKTRPHFIKMLSHDLKTPVAAEYTILQYLEAGQPGPLSDRQTELLKELLNSNRSLERFMRVLLHIYYIEEGLSSVSQREADLIHLIQNEISQLAPLAREKEVQFDTRLQNGPCMVKVDAAKFSQVVQLLIENLILFSKGPKQIMVTSDTYSDSFTMTLVDPDTVLNDHDVAEINRHGHLMQLNIKQNERTLAAYLADLLIREQGGTLQLQLEGHSCTYTVELPSRCNR